MSGFSFKHILLQIIQGSVVISALGIYFYRNEALCISEIKEYITLATGTILFVSFITGVLIDFIADLLESACFRFFKPPLYHLLTHDRWMGISLAHRDAIRRHLCGLSGKYKFIGSGCGEQNNNPCRKGDYFCFMDKKKTASQKNRFCGLLEKVVNWFNKRNKSGKEINYLLQVAKNKAFRDCKEYQRDQIDSFFILYIFCRNIALALIVVCILFFCEFFIYHGIAAISLIIAFVLASYRYYLYYLRILLGTTLSVEN